MLIEDMKIFTYFCIQLWRPFQINRNSQHFHTFFKTFSWHIFTMYDEKDIVQRNVFKTFSRLAPEVFHDSFTSIYDILIMLFFTMS